jgi:hypothetical protein
MDWVKSKVAKVFRRTTAVPQPQSKSECQDQEETSQQQVETTTPTTTVSSEDGAAAAGKLATKT